MKKLKEIDKNYDYLTILVKREKLEEVENRYKFFSWEILKEDEHERFGNIVVVEMRRIHKIKNKDNLQYLQVQMEFLINREEMYKRNKHKRSALFGLIFGILCAFIFACGLVTLLNHISTVEVVFGIIFVVIGLFLNILLLFLIFKMSREEDRLFEENSIKISKQLDEVCEMAKQQNKELQGEDKWLIKLPIQRPTEAEKFLITTF